MRKSTPRPPRQLRSLGFPATDDSRRLRGFYIKICKNSPSTFSRHVRSQREEKKKKNPRINRLRNPSLINSLSSGERVKPSAFTARVITRAEKYGEGIFIKPEEFILQAIMQFIFETWTHYNHRHTVSVHLKKKKKRDEILKNHQL